MVLSMLGLFWGEGRQALLTSGVDLGTTVAAALRWLICGWVVIDQ